MPTTHKSYEWIKNLSPGEIRAHINTVRVTSQNANPRFWESLSILEAFLESKGLAEVKTKPEVVSE